MGEHDQSSTQRRKGTVKWFNPSKGFGFITPRVGEEDLFVHQVCRPRLSVLVSMFKQSTIHAEGFRSLREGESVEYDLAMGEDGRYKAVNVTGPNGYPPQVFHPVSFLFRNCVSREHFQCNHFTLNLTPIQFHRLRIIPLNREQK